MKWSKAISDHLSLKIGLRMTPLSCVVREKVETDSFLPLQDEGKPHSTKYGSVESDIIHLAHHDHPWHLEDDSKVHHILEESKIGTMCAGSINALQKRKDGRATCMPILLQNAGPEKLAALLQACDRHLHVGTCKSNNFFPLSGHTSKNRQSYVEMTQ